ncbi:MAG: class I SAM-dependent methyltransferase [Armatimonadota bacterium]|jgi:SAM-dependent methyltransferase
MGKQNTSMSHEASTYEQIADGIASYAGESGGDVQRYIVAPAMLEMIGAATGKEILDLYCGAGYFSRRLAALGANVTAVDNSDRLVGIAREINSRERCTIQYAVAEANDLSVIEDSMFDDIVCNMGLTNTRDLAGTVAALARLVKLGGRFIFSIAHPCFSMPDACWIKDPDGRMLYEAVDNYYAERWWLSDLAGPVKERNRVKHRTLSTYVNALSARGFNVRRISEPRPTQEVLTLKPHLAIFERVPAAMVIEAIFPYL